MVAKRGGLGRNLSALLGQTAPVKSDDYNATITSILPITQLHPGKYQPRRDFDEEALSELAASIKQQGLLQPLVAREIAPQHYELIAGERRWRACQMAGIKEVPVILRQVDDETAMALALIENLQREDLNAIDQARAMQRLTVEFALTHQQVAELLCKSRAAVSNYLRLLHLNAEVMVLLEHGDLDMGHARCLLALSHEEQLQAAQLIIAGQLSVRETERLVHRVKENHVPKMTTQDVPSVTSWVKQRLEALANQWQTAIQIKPGKAGKGSLVIKYQDLNALEKLLHSLGRIDN